MKRDHEDWLYTLLKASDLPTPEREYRFAPPRRWRLDFAWPEHGLWALEFEGGIWTKGRHTSPKGFLADIEKYNEAALLGWRVLRAAVPSGKQEPDAGAVLAMVERALSSPSSSCPSL